MTTATYGEVVKLAEQLTSEEQTTLITHLLDLARRRQLTVAERKALMNATILSNPVAQEPSIRREDWYDDDGR